MDADTGRAHGVARLIRPLALYEAVNGGVQRLVARHIQRRGRFDGLSHQPRAGFQRHRGGNKQHPMIVLGLFLGEAAQQTRQRQKFPEIFSGLAHG